jgi:hypothetical protein
MSEEKSTADRKPIRRHDDVSDAGAAIDLQSATNRSNIKYATGCRSRGLLNEQRWPTNIVRDDDRTISSHRMESLYV